MSTTLERLQYGYDRDSRRTWRRRALTTGEDNAYGYDGLSQVTQSALGTLNQNCTVPAGEENWNYDPTGNWRGYRVDENGAVALDQQRVHDKGNRLTQIAPDPYPVLLDRVGRVQQISPGADGDWNESQKIKWDARGRVTKIRRSSDDAVLGTYAYDGLTRRTTRTVAGVTHHCYYSDQWRPLEERKNAETTAELQYYWGARHRDDLARRDRATTDGGSLNETRYVLMDYYSPAAITDETGAVTERYAFSAFGIRRILTPEFAPRSTSECNFVFAFQGQFRDAESGFLNYGFRYYAPHLGRWLSKDPLCTHLSLVPILTNSTANNIGGPVNPNNDKPDKPRPYNITTRLFGDAISLQNRLTLAITPGNIDPAVIRNIYAFVDNNPLSSVDAFGLSIEEEALKKYLLGQALAGVGIGIIEMALQVYICKCLKEGQSVSVRSPVSQLMTLALLSIVIFTGYEGCYFVLVTTKTGSGLLDCDWEYQLACPGKTGGMA